MKPIFNILLFFDFYGANVNFTIKGRKSSKTILGGLLSLASLTIIISFSIIFAQDFFFNLNPSITLFTTVTPKTIQAHLLPTTIPIGFSLGTLMDKQFMLFAHYFSINLDNNHLNPVKQLPLRQCKNEDFPLIDPAIRDRNYANMFLCVDNLNYSIQGAQYDRLHEWLTVVIEKCDNTMYDCEDDAIINRFINYEVPFEVIIGVTTLNPSNYSNPMPQTLKVIRLYLSSSSIKTTEIFLKTEYIETDDGFIFENKKTELGYSIESVSNDFKSVYDPSKTLLASYRISASNSTGKTVRIYTKIQNILANIGGIASLILTICPYITLIFSEMKIEEAIFNKLVCFDSNLRNNLASIQMSNMHMSLERNECKTDNNNKLYLRNSSKQLSYPNKNSSKLTYMLTFNNIRKSVNDKAQDGKRFSKRVEHSVDINSSFQKLNHLKSWSNDKVPDVINMKKTSAYLHFGFCEILKMKICKCCKKNTLHERKIKVYNKHLTRINDYREITQLYYELEEMNKLKFILLNSSQLAAFKFIGVNYTSLSSDVNIISKSKIDNLRDIYANKYHMASLCLKYHTYLKENNKSLDFIDQNIKSLITENL